MRFIRHETLEVKFTDCHFASAGEGVRLGLLQLTKCESWESNGPNPKRCLISGCGVCILYLSCVEIWVFLFKGEYCSKSETWSNWRKSTTRRGACGLIWLDPRKLTRPRSDSELIVWEIIDFLFGGAWPFFVGGLPCQVNSGNERDPSRYFLVLFE